MGNQVIQRRAEIAPAQIDSILAYMTRSVRDISVASRQQASQYERMTGAMQAVIEIAEQVAGNSQQTTESSERLDLVVRQLQQLVGVSRLRMRSTTPDAFANVQQEMDMQAGLIVHPGTMQGQPAVRAMRPAPRLAAGMPQSGSAYGMSGRNGQMDQMPWQDP